MKVAFRVDSSTQIGIGHLMRCLNLADALKKNNHEIVFICKKLQGNLNSQIKYKVHRLPNNSEENLNVDINLYDFNQKIDADLTTKVVPSNLDLLIIDSYELNHIWHKQIRPFTKKIMVIDDLANREFDCDILLNQNPGFYNIDYKNKVSEKCKLLIGSRYALLRPEFLMMRRKALEKRKKTKKINNILISLGGSDINNLTYDILKDLPNHFKITIVLGKTSPHNKMIMNYIATKNIELIENATNMAELMFKADLAIGACGITSLERCCLGLPTLMYVLAENQIKIANNLESIGAVLRVKNLKVNITQISNNFHLWIKMSIKSDVVCDGMGTNRVIQEI